jgi:ankyrin repeat protein
MLPGEFLGLSEGYPGHPFFEALHRGMRTVTHRMIKAGIPQTCHAKDWTDPVSFAATHDDTESIHLLIEQGFDIDTPDQAGMTPLHHACSEGAAIGAQALIKLGADINRPVGLAGDKRQLRNVESGVTPLFLAINSGNLETVELLLKNGASHTKLSKWQNCAMTIAIQQKATSEIVQSIFDARYEDAEIAQKNSWLTDAVKCNNTEVIHLLIDMGAEITTKYHGRSMLQIATPEMRRAIRSSQMKNRIAQCMQGASQQALNKSFSSPTL